MADCPRKLSEDAEHRFLSALATRSAGAERKFECPPDDFRTEFDRDYTRIIHCKAFRRLRHKTQVFVSPQNDHLCTRIEHSLHVASISRTISKAIGLNNELVAAIAVGHDLGHAPFGHHGEEVLGKLAEHTVLGHFWHEEQSLRVVDKLEHPYDEHAGLNLTLPVRDGIRHHCGEEFPQQMEPRNHAGQPSDSDPDKRGKLTPMTLEGCVVRYADVIAYIGRDLEDAFDQGIVKPDDLPPVVKRVLGSKNREIIARFVGDLYNNHVKDGKPNRIRFSDDVVDAARQLYAFNRERIYNSPQVKRHFRILDYAIRLMFEELGELIQKCADDLSSLRRETKPHVRILHDFLTEDLKLKTVEIKEVPRYATDFIAGMTDSFFLTTFTGMFREDLEKLFSYSHGAEYNASTSHVSLNQVGLPQLKV